MKTRKPKKKVVLTTTASLLVLASLSVSAYAASSMDTIKKNELITETSPAISAAAAGKTVQTNGPVTEAQAIEIGKQALSSMFGADVAKSNVTQDAAYLDEEQIKDTAYASPVWQLNWMEVLDGEDVGKYLHHAVTVDAATGDILSARSDRNGQFGQSIQDISEESARSIASDFIEKNGLAQGTTVETIHIHDFFGKALLAKITLANGKQATVVINKLNGDVNDYEGDVTTSAYEVDAIAKANDTMEKNKQKRVHDHANEEKR